MPAAHPGVILAVLLAAGITYALSQTLILPAMPALVRELGAPPLAVSWLLTAYLISASVATPLIGRLGDLLGRGRSRAAPASRRARTAPNRRRTPPSPR